MRLAIRCICLISCLSAFSQKSQTDSLKKQISLKEGAEKVHLLNELAGHYKNVDVDSAIYWANSAYLLAEKISNKEGMATTLGNLGSMYEATGEYDTAIFLHQKALNQSKEISDSVGIADAYNNIGIVYDLMGLYDRSLQNYFEALKLYEKYSSEPFDRAKVYSNIGIVYKNQKEFGNVLTYYSRALEIYEDIGSVFGSTVTQGNMSSVYLLTGDFEEAIASASSALNGYDSLGYYRYVPYMQHNLAIAFDSLSMLSEADSTFKLAIEGYQKYNNQYESISATIGLASNQRKKGNLKEAIELSFQAVKESKKIEAFQMVSDALLEHSRSLAAAGDFESAFHYFTRHSQAKDSLFEETKVKNIFELQTKYETDKKEQQLALQKAQLTQTKQQLIISIVGSICIILLVGLIFIRIRSKQRSILAKQKQQDQRDRFQAVLQAEETERKRIATELHDGLGQLLSTAKLSLSAMESELADVSKPLHLIGTSINEVRNISHNLMPSSLIKLGFSKAVEEIVATLAESGKLEATLHLDELELDENTSVHLYRSIQEMINNSLKYARASKLSLCVFKKDDLVELTYEDNGLGFDIESIKKSQGIGWKSIYTRVELLGGSININSSKGRGTTVLISIPHETTYKTAVS